MLAQAANLPGMQGCPPRPGQQEAPSTGTAESCVPQQEQQKAGRKPCRFSNTPGLPREEGGMLLAARFGVTGNKHSARVPHRHRDGLSSPEVFSCSTRQIRRGGICQRGEFDRLENLWLQFGPLSCPRTVSLREEFSYHGLPYQYGDQVPPLPTAL